MPAATTFQTDRLLQIAHERPLLDPSHTPEQSIAAMQDRVVNGLTTDEARDLLQAAWRTDPFPAEIRPLDPATRARLRGMAKTKAVLGLEVSREETLAFVEAWLAEPRTHADLDDTFTLNYRHLRPHPDGKAGTPLATIPGIGTPAFAEGHYAVFMPDNATPGADQEPDTQPTDQPDDQPTDQPTDQPDDHVLRFYRIHTPTTGARTGVLVIRRYGSSVEYEISSEEARAAVAAINADADAAAFRYSDHYNNCWVCGRRLTDAISRLLSTGPICRGFHEHQGLRLAANEVDRNPERRLVYRALRQWALDRGFTDPKTKEERNPGGVITASMLASAWSGVPGILALGAPEAIRVVQTALTSTQVPTPITEALNEAPADTVTILIEAGVLSQGLLELFIAHHNPKVKQAALAHFTAVLDTI